MQCTAKSKQSGEQCKRHAVPGGTKCKIHGGGSLKGIASPTTKTGRYSKYLPQRLTERYHEALDDTELVALAEEIALVDSRLADLLTRVDSGEAGKAWKDAQQAYKDLQHATSNGDKGGIRNALADLDSILGRGLSDYAAWDEISRLLDQRRRLAESERKRRVDMEQMITAEQATLLMGALLDSIRRHVKDRDALTAIQADFVRFATIPGKVEIEDGKK